MLSTLCRHSSKHVDALITTLSNSVAEEVVSPHGLCRCLGRLLGAPLGNALSHLGSCLLSQPGSYVGSFRQLHMHYIYSYAQLFLRLF